MPNPAKRQYLQKQVELRVSCRDCDIYKVERPWIKAGDAEELLEQQLVALRAVKEKYQVKWPKHLLEVELV